MNESSSGKHQRDPNRGRPRADSGSRQMQIQQTDLNRGRRRAYSGRQMHQTNIYRQTDAYSAERSEQRTKRLFPFEGDGIISSDLLPHFVLKSSKPARSKSSSKAATLSGSSQPKPLLFLDQLEVDVTGTIVVMIGRVWDMNAVIGRYVSTDFVVSDSKVEPANNKYLIDIAGYVTNVGRTSYTKTGSNTLEFYAGKPEGQSLRVTLWGELGDVLVEKKTKHAGELRADDRTKKGWNYPSCGYEKCRKGATRKLRKWVCEACNRAIDYPVFRYRLEAVVADDTAHTVVVMFNDTATELLKCFAESLMGTEDEYSDADDELNLPVAIRNLIGTTHVLEIKSHTYYEYGTFESFNCWKINPNASAKDDASSRTPALTANDAESSMKIVTKPPTVCTPLKPNEEKKQKGHDLEDSDVDEVSGPLKNKGKSDADVVVDTKKKRKSSIPDKTVKLNTQSCAIMITGSHNNQRITPSFRGLMQNSVNMHADTIIERDRRVQSTMNNVSHNNQRITPSLRELLQNPIQRKQAENDPIFYRHAAKFCPSTSKYALTPPPDENSRIVYSSPAFGERYYLRMLLNVVRGVKGFEELMTVNKRLCETFKETCFAYGLLNDDKEWLHAIAEASLWALGPQLRDIFVTMLLFYDVSRPLKLWEETWQTLYEDILENNVSSLILMAIGIASLLLPAGRTAHSRFVIPLELMENSTCGIKQNTQLAELMQEVHLIIWDEAPMTQRYAFEALDTTLRDILGFKDLEKRRQIFEGMTVLLGGDFRQILPVIPQAEIQRLSKLGINRTEPETLPLWVKIMSPPLEAWSKKGLSALASRIGTPLIVDVMTTRMCAEGVASLGYARVLVEANARKGLEDIIEVLYKNKTNGDQFMKKVRVKYDWKPPVCTHCGVFGHSENKCHKNLKIKEKIKENDKDVEGFIKVGNKKEKYNEGRKQYVNNFAERKYGNQKFVYRKKNNNVNENAGVSTDKCTNQESFSTPSQTQKKMWNVGDNVIKYIKSTANKFSVLQDIGEEPFRIKLSNKEKDEVEKYMMMDLQPSLAATNKWSKEMVEYFKERRKDQYRKKSIPRSGTAKFMTANEVSGLGSDFLKTTFIYAANKGKYRKELWKELNLNKRVIENSAWVIMGDVNVSLKLEDHSEGMSNFTQDMIDFQNCVNDVEIEDISYIGVHYT
ncbi:replication protein A 70 kDa DNA-binding subunit C-like protein [Tanacetum coccineum]